MIFRKRTFTGLGSNFYSFCSFNFKMNSISTLLHRAITLTSNWMLFDEEVSFLFKYFKYNCFPAELVSKTLRKIMDKYFSNRPLIPTVKRLNFYARFPYIFNDNFKKKFANTIQSKFGAIKVNLIPINPLTIGSLFNYKDRLCPFMSSGCIYMYKCPKCNLGNYIGSTKRLLKVRIDSHRGVSHRTGSKISNPEFSNIRNHSKICKTSINMNDFSVIGRVPNCKELPILETMMIKRLVPSLNTQTSAVQLYLS